MDDAFLYMMQKFLSHNDVMILSTVSKRFNQIALHVVEKNWRFFKLALVCSSQKFFFQTSNNNGFTRLWYISQWEQKS